MSETMKRADGRAVRLMALVRAVDEGRAGKALVEAHRADLDALEPEDVAAIVDRLVAGERPMEALKVLVAKIINLFHDPLEAGAARRAATTDFVRLLDAENEAMLAVIARGKASALALKAASGGSGRRDALDGLGSMRSELEPFEAHFRRKENVVFPIFESLAPDWRCVQVMWSIHDDARRELASLKELLAADDAADAALNACLGRLYFALNANAFRERCVLHPVLERAAPPGLLDGMLGELVDFGRGLVPEAVWEASFARARSGVETAAETAGDASPDAVADPSAGLIPLDSGALPAATVDLILKALPLDCTFVDAEDRVRWFSNGPHRIFPRSPAIIGREVRNCHPSESVGRVLAILEAFRSGRKDREDFWIRVKGRFVLIRYLAIRGASGEYLGCLEASQDLTDERALEGEKRLAE
ncbi:MAG: DUF438 domain-containing protein [Spirochaetales bacterium]|nr:DUF438 domain-containing protein [Spirochaetales bacterium]